MRKDYNGLRSQIPVLGQGGSREQQAQRAIAMEMQAICRELFVRSASGMMLADASAMPTDLHYQELAEQCHIAARSYFVGLGVIQVETGADPDSPAAE